MASDVSSNKARLDPITKEKVEMQVRIPLRRACQLAYHQASSRLRNPAESAAWRNMGSSQLRLPRAVRPMVKGQQHLLHVLSPDSDHVPVHHRHDEEPQPDTSAERPHVFGETFAVVDTEAPPPFRSRSYNMLAAMHMGAAATAFFLPDKVSGMMFEAATLNDVLVEPLLQVHSGEMLIGGALSLVLARLNEEDRISSNAGQRLNLGLAGFGAGALANTILDLGTLQTAGGAVAAVVAGTTLGICSANYAHINPDGLSVSKIAKSIELGLRRLLTFSTPLGLGYASLSAAFLVAGLTYLAVPHLSLLAIFGFPAGAASTYVWRTIGCAMATLLPAATQSLKIAADASKLGSRHPKTVNAALLGASVAHLVVLGPIWLLQQGGEYFPVVLGMWAAAAAVASAGLLAKTGAD